MFALVCLLRASSLDIPAQMCSPLFALLFLHVPGSHSAGNLKRATCLQPDLSFHSSYFPQGYSGRAGLLRPGKNLPVYPLGEGLESGWAVSGLSRHFSWEG